MQQHASNDDEEIAAKDAAIERAVASLEAGRGVSHTVVREWLLNLANGIRRPVPQADDDGDASGT